MDVSKRFEIVELLSRAAYGLDERRLELVAPCFAERSTFIVRVAERDPMTFEGHAAIMQLIEDSFARFADVRRHVVTNIFFESTTADSARVVSNLSLLSVHNGHASILTTGVYRDRIVFERGSYRIAVRDLSLDLPF